MSSWKFFFLEGWGGKCRVLIIIIYFAYFLSLMYIVFIWEYICIKHWKRCFQQGWGVAAREKLSLLKFSCTSAFCSKSFTCLVGLIKFVITMLLPYLVIICYECVTKNIFLISQPKHMLWVLKRTVLLSTQNISSLQCYSVISDILVKKELCIHLERGSNGEGFICISPPSKLKIAVLFCSTYKTTILFSAIVF